MGSHLQALYALGKTLDFVIFSKQGNPDQFVQFRLVRNDDDTKVIQLSVPHSDAVAGYRNRILEMVISQDLPVESQLMRHMGHAMKMDHVIFADDVEGAAEFSRAVFERVFDVASDGEIEIYRASGGEHLSMFSNAINGLQAGLRFWLNTIRGTR